MTNNGDPSTTQQAPSLIVRDATGNVFIFHLVRKDDDFTRSAQVLFGLVREASRNTPGPRYLMLAIDGHRNTTGGFDTDMMELQINFVIDFLGPYLTAISTPLLTEGSDVYLHSVVPQTDRVPDEFEMEGPS